jgi:hypothetical protein
LLYVDGHARAYYGTRNVQKTHVARPKFRAPATQETWVTGQDGDPVFIVVAEPSESPAGELRRRLAQLRQLVGEERRVTVCSPHQAGPRPSPPSATSSTTPAAATPAPALSCATKPSPTDAFA